MNYRNLFCDTFYPDTLHIYTCWHKSTFFGRYLCYYSSLMLTQHIDGKLLAMTIYNVVHLEIEFCIYEKLE